MDLVITRAGSKGVKDEHLRLIKNKMVIEFTLKLSNMEGRL